MLDMMQISSPIMTQVDSVMLMTVKLSQTQENISPLAQQTVLRSLTQVKLRNLDHYYVRDVRDPIT